MRKDREIEIPEIQIMGTLVRLHKRLKPSDLEKCELVSVRRGVELNTSPTIIIDFLTVTSIQEDFRDDGTIILDSKTACTVKESLEDVLEAWRKVKEFIGQ